LRFVDVDEDTGVTEGTTAAVALDGLFLDPADGLFVDELDGCQWARLYECSYQQLFLIITNSLSSPSPSIQLSQFLLFPLKTYLIIHDHLLKPRSHHSLLSSLLATAPHTLPVGRLHSPALLALSNRFLQWLIHVAFAARGHGIGAADWRGCRAVFGVVGWDGVVGAENVGGGEAAGAAAAEAAAG
jgi:hypothetical protein